MAGVRAPNFVIDCIEKNKKNAFETQSKSVLISSFTTKASFAVFLYGFLSSTANATDAILCIYGDENEKSEWVEVATDIFQVKKSSPRKFNIVDFDVIEDANTPLPPTPLVAFINCHKLETLFPFQRDFIGLSPFTSANADIQRIAYSYCADGTEPRAFSMVDTPLNYKNSCPSDPYSIVWDHVAFSHSTLRRSSSVFYLNALCVCLNRFLLDDDDDDPDDGDLHYYYNTLYCCTAEIPNYVSHNEEIDDVETLREVRDELYELILIDDAVVNFSVVLPTESHAASSMSSYVLTAVDVKVPPFRSIITWKSIQRPCEEYILDPSSRVSVLWIRHDDLTIASRRQEAIGRAHEKKQLHQLSAAELTQDRFSVAKTMMTYLYMWINHARPFYILCPFVSKAHELHKLQNVRPVHPKDDIIHQLGEDDSLVIFDTLFANDKEMNLTKTRCRLIFATFCGTVEENALAEFMCADKGLPLPKLPTPFRISEVPMYSMPVDPRRILLQLELTAIIFYDKHGTAHCTLYDCMSSAYDHILRHANRIFLPRSDQRNVIIAKLRRYYDRVHAAECTDSLVITDNIMRNASMINDLIERKLLLESILLKNETRSATKQMWTSAHNFFRRLNIDAPLTETVNKITYEMEDECQFLVEEELERMLALDKFLKQKSDKVSIKVSFNGNASLLRHQIDNRTRPPLPTTDGRPTCHRCRYCEQIFDSSHYMKQHVATYHADDDRIMSIRRCRSCNVTITGEYAYICHIRSDEHRERIGAEPLRYHCDNCEANFSKKKSLDRHMEAVHNPNAKVLCHACNIFVTEAQMIDHRLSEDHQRRISGATQTYCEYCKFESTADEPMQEHLRSMHHLRHVQAIGGLVPVTLVFNRWYLLLAAVEKLIDDSGYYMNIHEREALVRLENARQIIDDDDAFCNYVTLLCISLVMKPIHRKLYISQDQRSGMLVATMNGKTGIVGHFGSGDKREMIAEMFCNMNVPSLGHANLAYAPSGLHSEIVTHAKFLGLKVKRAPAATTFLGRLGVYSAYCAFREIIAPPKEKPVRNRDPHFISEEDKLALDEMSKRAEEYNASLYD